MSTEVLVMGDRADEDDCKDNPLGKTREQSPSPTRALRFANKVARDGAWFSKVFPLKTL